MQETRINFRYRNLPVTIEFHQDWTVKVPRKFLPLQKWLPKEFFSTTFSRQETSVFVTTPNGAIGPESVRQSHKDFPSWRAGRFEALKKLSREYFWGKNFREFRQEAFASLEEIEDLIAPNKHGEYA